MEGLPLKLFFGLRSSCNPAKVQNPPSYTGYSLLELGGGCQAANFETKREVDIALSEVEKRVCVCELFSNKRLFVVQAG